MDAFNPDYKRFPEFRKARAISFTQEAGEILIIPTGWFHQVEKTVLILNLICRECLVLCNIFSHKNNGLFM